MPWNVKAHIMRDVKSRDQSLGVDTFAGKIEDDDVFHNRIAFTSLLYNPNDGLIYCGITAYDNDILHTFDPNTGEFRSLGYTRVAEKYEVKVHRSLELDDDGTLFGASACLHDVNLRLEAPGGRIFSYTPETGKIRVLVTPVPHDYVQTISLDRKRRLIYGFTYPVFKFFKYDLATNETTNFDYVGSITHISALDDRGRLWGTWNSTRHSLFCYDPDADEITWHRHGLPGSAAASGMMYAGAGPVDSMINGGDGYLYIGSTSGALLRLEPESAEVEFLGKPFATSRMPGLTIGSDGLIYGCGGDGGDSLVFTYDRSARRFDVLGRVYEEERSIGCYRTHDICIVPDGRMFIAETDVPQRAGYLWECSV